MSEVDRPRSCYDQSAALTKKAVLRLPGGVNSNVRLSAPRRFFERGDGAWLWDVDGNDYVDYLLGQGPAFLGHANKRVNESVAAACGRGMLFGAQHPLEVEAAELLCRVLGWPEMVRFGVSGTEVVQGALRLARAATNRSMVIRFDGQYHGWLDNILVSRGEGNRPVAGSAGQAPSAFSDLIVLPWNDVEVVRQTVAEQADNIAALITEPVMFNSGAILPEPGYLEALRQICTDAGIVLIFDEVIAGFRIALGGAVEVFGVTPDLATYGKALAGGWPVAALAGKADLMERAGTGEVVHAGTFNGCTMAMAAVTATLQQLIEDPPYELVGQHGDELMSVLPDLAKKHGLPLRVQGLPVAFHATFSNEPTSLRNFADLQRCDLAGYARLAEHLANYGVWVAARGIWYVSAAHGPRELEATLARVDAAMADFAF
jgi:glutamate-1-semialdehyde 2,1-aminomutase